MAAELICFRVELPQPLNFAVAVTTVLYQAKSINLRVILSCWESSHRCATPWLLHCFAEWHP